MYVKRAAMPMRENLHPRRQVCEFPLAAQHTLQFSQFRVATVITTSLNVFCGNSELFRSLIFQERRLNVIRLGPLRRTVISQFLERRERFDFGEREPRAFKRHVAKKEPHRPGLGDLLNLIEIACGAVPVADVAAKSCTGDETTGNVIARSSSAKAVDGLIESNTGSGCIIACSYRAPPSDILYCQPEMGATKG
jgi:hypothetical protein